MKRMGVLPIVFVAAFAVACHSNPRSDNRNETAAVGTAGDADRNVVKDSDQDFINRQLSDGMAEVDLGKVASQKAVTPDVKRFGRMMVEDHTRAGDELKAIAAKYNVPASPQIDDRHKDLMDKLSKARGREYDRDYIKAMIEGHQDAVDALESRVDSTASLKDQVTNREKADTHVVPEKTDNALTAALNEWAAQALPVVRHHLDEARMIDDRNSRTNETARNNKVRGEK